MHPIELEQSVLHKVFVAFLGSQLRPLFVHTCMLCTKVIVLFMHAEQHSTSEDI